MVNMVTLLLSLGKWTMKMAGLKPYTVEIEPGTVMRFWVPSKTISKTKPISKPTKPVVVLLHGFCGDGLSTWWPQNIGFSSCSEMLLPSSVEGLKTLLSIGMVHMETFGFPTVCSMIFLRFVFSLFA
jgi:hypothetical protein